MRLRCIADQRRFARRLRSTIARHRPVSLLDGCPGHRFWLSTHPKENINAQDNYPFQPTPVPICRGHPHRTGRSMRPTLERNRSDGSAKTTRSSCTEEDHKAIEASHQKAFGTKSTFEFFSSDSATNSQLDFNPADACSCT